MVLCKAKSCSPLRFLSGHLREAELVTQTYDNPEGSGSNNDLHQMGIKPFCTAYRKKSRHNNHSIINRVPTHGITTSSPTSYHLSGLQFVIVFFLSLFLFPLRGITGRFGFFLSYRSSDHRAQFVVILCPPRIFYFLSCRRFGCNSSERPVIPRNPSSNARYMFVLANLWQATLRVSQEYELATAIFRGQATRWLPSRFLIRRRSKA